MLDSIAKFGGQYRTKKKWQETRHYFRLRIKYHSTITCFEDVSSIPKAFESFALSALK